jgi:hypothetical protein
MLNKEIRSTLLSKIKSDGELSRRIEKKSTQLILNRTQSKKETD